MVSAGCGKAALETGGGQALSQFSFEAILGTILHPSSKLIREGEFPTSYKPKIATEPTLSYATPGLPLAGSFGDGSDEASRVRITHGPAYEDVGGFDVLPIIGAIPIAADGDDRTVHREATIESFRTGERDNIGTQGYSGCRCPRTDGA
jgi:hypothetical protein